MSNGQAITAETCDAVPNAETLQKANEYELRDGNLVLSVDGQKIATYEPAEQRS